MRKDDPLVYFGFSLICCSNTSTHPGFVLFSTVDMARLSVLGSRRYRLGVVVWVWVWMFWDEMEMYNAIQLLSKNVILLSIDMGGGEIDSVRPRSCGAPQRCLPPKMLVIRYDTYVL
jgi:hypothetical protein